MARHVVLFGAVLVLAAALPSVDLDKTPNQTTSNQTTQNDTSGKCAEHDAKEHASTVVRIAIDAIMGELMHGQWQIANALGSLIFGVAMVVSGNKVYQLVIIGSIMVFTYFLTLVQIADVLYTDRHYLQMIQSGSVSLLAGVAAMQGLKGVEVLIGITVGVVVAHEFHTLWIEYVPSFSWYEFLLVIVDNLVIFGLCLAVVLFRTHVIDFVLPYLGVPLIVTSIMWLVTNFVAVFSHHVIHDAWIQYIVMLFSLGGKGSQVGIFKGRLIDGTSISLDWVLGWVFMVLLIIMVFLKWFFWGRRRRTSRDSDDLKEPIFRGRGSV
uniref:Uncharacterized protein n=1 Tax=Noctiluca scintillans TaxID=2966 RepID=A0A7S1FHK0_NOCSC|mmetsp:Transcript_64089/g.169854  ORF Transcript_64089/g.169854 Transcript_64089/m.169854 type:complete len:323 (+) Transcript_64089:142-1110(+)